ncbi:MAG TPA: carboxymuconolactone decarboxylase [Flavisolibacter sp.]|jgi:uncharacterized peroxidase-related enzyme
MPHINLNNDQPGILSLFAYNPATAGVLNDVAQVLLRGSSSLEEYERELIASYVSHLNKCNFCFHSHAAATDALFGDARLTADPARMEELGELRPKLRSLLAVAAKVQQSGLAVTSDDISQAKLAGASDKEIHDTVLIAAAFCMYNRYVDGLNTISSQQKKDYVEVGEKLAKEGYRHHEFAV